MKSDQPSRTALAACAVRALESLLPEKMRLFEDPYAAAFLEPGHRAVLSLCRGSLWIRNSVERLLDRRFPGVPADFICRTRYIDELFAADLRGGMLRRVVLVGAGYDMRALRIGTHSGLQPQIFEIDHPATQARKNKIMRSLVSKAQLERMESVGHDLSAAPATCSTLQLALKPTARTFWIAEGLLSYLARDAVQELLRWMVSVSSPGSRAVFTYVSRDFVERRVNGKASEKILRYLEERGEPFLSGWTPDEMARLCSHAGLAVREDISEADLARRLLAPVGRTLNTVKEFRIATAVVPDNS
jgi:methyltransferase (TIGR00027 family)